MAVNLAPTNILVAVVHSTYIHSVHTTYGMHVSQTASKLPAYGYFNRFASFSFNKMAIFWWMWLRPVLHVANCQGMFLCLCRDQICMSSEFQCHGQ